MSLGFRYRWWAQCYNLNANQVFRWRRLFREPDRAGTGRFVPVVVGTAPGHEAGAVTMSPPSDAGFAAGASTTGRIEIVPHEAQPLPEAYV